GRARASRSGVQPADPITGDDVLDALQFSLLDSGMFYARKAAAHAGRTVVARSAVFEHVSSSADVAGNPAWWQTLGFFSLSVLSGGAFPADIVISCRLNKIYGTEINLEQDGSEVYRKNAGAPNQI